MKSKKPINLKMRATLNNKGQIFSFKVYLDPKDEAGNSVQFPIELKKGEIERMIALYDKKKDLISSKEVVINMAIQDKKFIEHSVCKTEPVNPPPPPTTKNLVNKTNLIADMFKGLSVMVQEVG